MASGRLSLTELQEAAAAQNLSPQVRSASCRSHHPARAAQGRMSMVLFVDVHVYVPQQFRQHHFKFKARKIFSSASRRLVRIYSRGCIILSEILTACSERHFSSGGVNCQMEYLACCVFGLVVCKSFFRVET